ncbi:FmdB family zinc ribbon protein [Williamsia maris]|uniref:Regulatory protein, FmdB family n=1 Tax=Williamsia maris TaxID=72806 RepID=A0ABT1HAS5_9NOCA|nr:FmdB family zinc ribbon protein [Williamsia maris]MCP2175357.1 putative regulatory protein, FmdB family [Williamsia maris]
MPLYGFRCDQGCVALDRSFPMSTVPDGIDCPGCGSTARRRITPVPIGVGASAAMRLQDATRATADAPRVVSGVPASGGSARRRPVSADPRHRRLPRP